MTTTIASGRALDVVRIELLNDLDRLAAEWRALEARCPDLTVFSTWEWCSTVARYYGSEEPFWVYSMRDGDELVGLAPLAQTKLGRGLRVLRHIGCGLGPYSYADYQDLLVAQGYEDGVVEALCDALDEASTGWDVLHLQELPESSRTPALLSAAAAARGWRVVGKTGHDVHPLSLPDSWESYRRQLTNKTRKGVERRQRKLARERGGEVVRIRDDADVEQAMDALFDLHTRRWSTVGKPGIFRDDYKRAFHKEIARKLQSRGALRLTLLKANGRPVAVAYGFTYDGAVYAYSSGFLPDAEWSQYALGSSLDLHDIRHAVEEGLCRFDFLRGDGHYKDHYGSETCYNRDLLVFRDIRAQLHFLAARLARAARRRLRRFAFRGDGLRPGG